MSLHLPGGWHLQINRFPLFTSAPASQALAFIAQAAGPAFSYEAMRRSHQLKITETETQKPPDSCCHSPAQSGGGKALKNRDVETTSKAASAGRASGGFSLE